MRVFSELSTVQGNETVEELETNFCLVVKNKTIK